MKRVLVGISGGVDSAVTAYRLKKAGYDVIGAHLQITEKPLVSIERLKQLETALSIPICIIDGQKSFEEIVIAGFRNDHLNGRTPSPCVICNPELKWRLLCDKAKELGAEFVASGHYIQKEFVDGLWYLKKGLDAIKDQSYFLYGLTQKQLGLMFTPLGDITKEEVRQHASAIGLEFLLKQRESTGLCFSQGLSYPDLLKKYIPEVQSIGTGNVVNALGEVMGEHQGYLYYTIGQKRGFEIHSNEQKGLCVVRIDASTNELVVDVEDSLWVREFTIGSCKFVSCDKVMGSNVLEVVVRGIGRNPKGFGRLIPLSENTYRVELDNPAWAMAPGQPVVFYENNLLLGGGIVLA